MRKLIIVFGVVLVVLIIVLSVVLYMRSTLVTTRTLNASPTPYPTLMPTSTRVTEYPEYLLPSPESLAPPDDPNSWENASQEQKEFSTLADRTPIQEDGLRIDFDFSNSSFIVTISSQEGAIAFENIRKQYPTLKDSLFDIREIVEGTP